MLSQCQLGSCLLPLSLHGHISSPSGSGIPCSATTASWQLFEMQVPHPSAHLGSGGKGCGAVTATTENKPMRWQGADLCLWVCAELAQGQRYFLQFIAGQRGNALTLPPFRFLMKLLTPLQVQFKDRKKSQAELT